MKLSGDANHKCLSSLLKRLAYQMQNTYRSEGIRKGADSVRLSSSMTVIAYPGPPHSLVLCCPTLSYLTKSAPCPLHLEIAIVLLPIRRIMSAVSVCLPLATPHSPSAPAFFTLHLPRREPTDRTTVPKGFFDGTAHTATDGTDYKHVTFRNHPQIPPRGGTQP